VVSGDMAMRWCLVQVSCPMREPSFAAQRFMADVFSMPGSRPCNGVESPVLFRNAAAVPRPWEEHQPCAASHDHLAQDTLAED
jgi:hypothetical protein